VHIASGTESHRILLIENPPLLKSLLQHMASQADTVRIACLWTVINLIVPDESTSTEGPLPNPPPQPAPPTRTSLTVEDCLSRARILRHLGFYERLGRIKDEDTSLDVRERAKNALAHFDALGL
jgi:hypothetical protein